jgi:PAS domain S-box-containing protein
MISKIRSAFTRSAWLVLGGIVVLSALTLLFIRLLTAGETVHLTAEEKAWLKAHPVIRLAPDPDFPPTEFLDANGAYRGLSADYVALVQQRLGIRFQVVKLANWAEVLKKARLREVDVLAAVTKTPERSEYLLFSKPYIQFPAVIVTRDTFAGSLNLRDLAGRKVDIKEGYAARYYVTTNYPRIKVDVVPDIRTGLKHVADGKCDAMLENLLSTSYYLEKDIISNLRVAGEAEFVYRISFGVRNDWPVLRTILDKGLAAVSAEEREVIYQKWVPLGSRYLLINRSAEGPLLMGAGLLALIVATASAWNRSLVRQVGKKTRELHAELDERLRIEAALRESEAQFRALAETSPGAIVVYQGEQRVYVNPAFAKLTGYSEQECRELFFLELIEPDYRDMMQSYARSRQQGEPVPSRYEARIRTRDGQSRWVLVCAGAISYRGMPAGIACMFDITECRQVVEELRRAKEDLEQRVSERTADLLLSMEKLRFTQFAVEKAQDQAFWHSRDGRIFYVNESACTSLGYDRDELIGMSVFEIDPSITEHEVGKLWDILKKNGSLTLERTHRAKNGRTYPVEIRGNYVVFDGNQYLCCFVNDISERKRTQEALRMSEASLRRAHDELEVRVKERTGQLTSLAAELSRAEELERRRIATELHDQVAQTLALGKIKLGSLLLSDKCGDGGEDIREIMGHLSTSIEEIRSLTFQLSPPILHEMGLDAALEWLADEFREKYGVRIAFDDDGHPKPLEEEIAGALFRMSRELLVNIIKHARAENVRITSGVSSGCIRVRISDDGVGFDPSCIVRSGSATNSYGLLNVHHRMKHLGGQLIIESRAGRGTAATLEIPCGFAGSP